MNLFSHKISLAVIALFVASASWGFEQRLKVEGVWDGDIFQIQRIKERDPDKNVRQIRISGTVWNVSQEDRSLRIGPVRLTWQASQHDSYSSVRVGDTLQVDAIQSGSSSFGITRSEPASLKTTDSVELIGALTGFQNDEDWTELWLAGVSARAPRRLFRNGRMRLNRLDDKRPKNQFVFRIGDVETTLGGELELKSDLEMERDLDRDSEDRQLDIDQQAQIEAFFEISDTLSAFAEIKFERTERYKIPWQRIRSESELKRGEFWIYVNQPFGLPAGIQVGRQNFAEVREWWWDSDLDAIRLDARFRDLVFEIAVAEEVGREILNADHADAEDVDIFRILARGTLRLSSELSLDLFLVHQNDHSSAFSPGEIIPAHREDEDDATLTWTGARASGTVDLLNAIETDYWIDIARVQGDEIHYEFDEVDAREIVVASVAEQDRSGWAFDAGATFKWSDTQWGPFAEPAITLGYAMGSGDDGSDGTFVSTGLNDNNGKYNGVDRFRYYGELTRPELSNLRVTTLAIGLRVGEDSSVELVHHNYRQPQNSISHSLRIDADANGRSADLGAEINLVLGIEEWEHWEFEAVLSHFIPGTAFDNQHSASGFSFKLDYNF